MFQSLLSDDVAHFGAPLYFPDVSSYGLAMATFTTAPTGTQAAPATTTTTVHGYVRSLPDKLRCGYTSKRCENPRTVKKSGGLHRFCAYHRERANKNQWRVDNRRRILRRMGQPSKSGSSDCGSPRSVASDTVDDNDTSELFDSVKRECNGTMVLELVDLDPAGSPNSLSEQDATILNAMLFDDDEEPFTVNVNVQAKGPCAQVSVSTPALLGPQTPGCQSMVFVDANAQSCVCAECLAWSTMFYYEDAMQSSRKSGNVMDMYARI